VGATAEVGTWDCGYAAPTSRMQYTSSSFAAMLVGLLSWALRPNVHEPHLARTFPTRTIFHSHVPDTVLDRFLVPIFSFARQLMTWLRPIQSGSVHVYLLYILGAIVALLIWS
jgi:hypothetical protein